MSPKRYHINLNPVQSFLTYFVLSSITTFEGFFPLKIGASNAQPLYFTAASLSQCSFQRDRKTTVKMGDSFIIFGK